MEKWIERSPDVLGEDLLVIQKELPLPSGIRLDLLAIDGEANLVVIELKRDKSGNDAELQAIKYASYCSAFHSDEIFSYYALYLKSNVDEAKRKIREFIDDELDDEELEDSLNRDQRIILVAGEFNSDVISAVLWLLSHEIEIKCIRLETYIDSNGSLFINPDVILPLPEAEDILKRKQIKEKESRPPIITYDDKGTFNLSDLEERLRTTLNRPSKLTPRLINLLEILLSEDRVFRREEVLRMLFEKKVGSDVGQTGRYLSGLSQFLTKKRNSHLRQIIEYTTTGGPGGLKDNYKITSEYRELIKSLVDQLNKGKPTCE
ncbi:MAG: endonuclease NucS [Methanothrix sp.]|nr:endonuclease NucS [Methanothrix sp.]